MADGKLILRKTLLKARRALPEGECRKMSDSICGQIRRLIASGDFTPWYETGKKNTVLLYCSADNEVDLSPLFGYFATGGQCYYPRTYSKGTQNLMDFHRIKDLAELRQGAYGLREPSAQAPLLDADMGLCLIPGVGFDEKGGRLGHGVGYYDGFLSEHPGFLKIGVCYECQLADEIPMDEHDVPMQYIVTERRVIKIDNA